MYTNPTPGSYDIVHALFGNSLNNIQDWFSLFFKGVGFVIVNFFAKFAIFSSFFSSAMVIVVAIYIVRYNEMRRKIIDKAMPTGVSESKGVGEEEINPKWKLVEEHINSDDPNKWKLAIIEADIVLSDLLDSLNLPGEGVGEKLKAVEGSSFKSIEEAWEAHKIRNAIAHEGSDFLINQREAKRVLGLYQKVFDEFDII